MSVRQYDEFVATLRDVAESCSIECFARHFAEQTIQRLQGMRAENVSLLRLHGVELIDSVEKFDASRHRAVGFCPRPEGKEGEGEVKKVGFLLKTEGKEKVLQPAIVVLYEDVEPQTQ